jgi:uncharacterized protein
MISGAGERTARSTGHADTPSPVGDSDQARTPSSQPHHGIVVAKDLMVPMRDGTLLATDVYFPAAGGVALPGPFPVLLGRTSYGKASEWQWVIPVAEFFTPRGYVVALQDLRGRGRSQGKGEYLHVANLKDGVDGYDTVEWLAAQSWSNGRVGTVGSSQGGMAQTTLALQSPPHLAAIWPDVAPTNGFTHHFREGGAMLLQMFAALFIHAYDAQEIRDDPVAQQAIADASRRVREWVLRTPFRPGETPLALVPNLEKILFEYYWRGEYDEFWQAEYNDYERYFPKHPDVPGTFSDGWWDPFVVGAANYFMTMSRQNRSPQRLIIGPWTHSGMREGATFAGDVDFGPDAAWGDAVYNELRLRWFDRWLKDLPNGVEHESPVRLFVMGGGDGRRTSKGKMNHGGHWRFEQEWPLARARYTPYYLHAGGSLSPEAPTEESTRVDYTFDPSRPVPTLASNVTGFVELLPNPEGVEEHFAKHISLRARQRTFVISGAIDQVERPGIFAAQPPYLPLSSRADVVVFQTPPLREPLEVTGPITVTLWVSSSAPDTDFTAKLIDVHPANPDYPSGYAMNLVEGIIRARYREGFDKPRFMRPAEVYRLEIKLAPTSNVFAVGHRIRLDISSSSFPRYDINPNTGEAIGRHTHMELAHNTIHLGRDHACAVVLPVIPMEPT